MRCDEFEERLSAFLEDELPPVERSSFLTHAGQCAACGAALEGVRAVRYALRGLAVETAPPQYQLRLLGLLQDGLERTSLWVRTLAAGVALAIVLAILLWPQPEPLPQLANPRPGSLWARQADVWIHRPGPHSDAEMVPVHPDYAETGRYSHAQMRLVAY